MTHFLAFDQCSESFPHKFFCYDSLKTANIYPDVIVWGLIVERSQHIVSINLNSYLVCIFYNIRSLAL